MKVMHLISGGDSGGAKTHLFELLDKLSEISKMEIPSSLSQLKTKEVRFNVVCNKEDMKNEADKFMKD